MDLYLLITIFFVVSLKNQKIKIKYIKPYSGSLGLIIIAFIIVALIGVLIEQN